MVREHCTIKKIKVILPIIYASVPLQKYDNWNPIACMLGAEDGNFYILEKKTLQILFENYDLQSYVVYPSLKKNVTRMALKFSF